MLHTIEFFLKLANQAYLLERHDSRFEIWSQSGIFSRQRGPVLILSVNGFRMVAKSIHFLKVIFPLLKEH